MFHGILYSVCQALRACLQPCLLPVWIRLKCSESFSINYIFAQAWSAAYRENWKWIHYKPCPFAHLVQHNAVHQCSLSFIKQQYNEAKCAQLKLSIEFPCKHVILVDSSCFELWGIWKCSKIKILLQNFKDTNPWVQQILLQEDDTFLLRTVTIEFSSHCQTNVQPKRNNIFNLPNSSNPSNCE